MLQISKISKISCYIFDAEILDRYYKISLFYLSLIDAENWDRRIVFNFKFYSGCYSNVIYLINRISFVSESGNSVNLQVQNLLSIEQSAY